MWDWNTYFLFLSALLLGYLFLSFYDKKSGVESLTYLTLGLLPTFLLLAMRGDEVGIDLIRYEFRIYTMSYTTSYIPIQFLSEPGFKLIEWVSYKWGGLQTFIFLTSLIEYLFLFLAFRILKTKGIDVRLIYLFFIAYIVIRSFNIVRNGITWTCSLCAYAHLFASTKEDKKKYWFYSILALTLHNSAIINIPVYFVCSALNKKHLRKKDIIYFTTLIVAAFLFIYLGKTFFMDIFTDLTSERYSDSHFETRDEGFGYGNIIYRLPFLFLIIYSKEQLKRNFGNGFYPLVGLFLFDFVIVQLKYISQDFERLSLYTGLGQVILWGLIAMAHKKLLGKLSTFIVFCIGIVYFTYYMYRWGVEGGGGEGIGIMPYKFFWE